ncbi:MAG: AMP-binding protein [Spirochaetes bacterium]|nr:AMP-binding protein [Spirochaetota bacterium]
MYTLECFTLVEMVEKSSKHYGKRPALSLVGGASYSYSEVAEASLAMAVSLYNQGIGRGDRVALLAENSPRWGIAYLGIIRAGAVAVPILIDFPGEQIGNIIRHSGAAVVICSERLFQRIKAQALPLRFLDVKDGSARDGLTWASLPGTHPSIAAPAQFHPSVSADDIAMIVYTSGTTGLSKGVMLSHRNLLSNARACNSIIVLHRTDKLLSILPLAHAYEFTIGFLIPFLAGSEISYIDRPPSPTVLLPALKAVRPTIMLSVPLVIEKIYRSNIKPSLEAMRLYANPLIRRLLILFAGFKLMKTFGGRIRFFGIGGAPLSSDVETFLKQARFPYAIGYGLTETSPLLAGCNPRHTKVRSTGPALKGLKLRIAEPKPGSGEGEIQAKGDSVFKGYYLDEVRTRESFTEDGWFKTGDLGYIDAKGRLSVRGRLKTMILGASGENIYPEEVEAVLNQSPYVAESLVVEGEGGLTAFVYLKSEVLENLEARIQDTIEEAESITSKLGAAISSAEKSMAESIEHALSDVEKSAVKLLESIRKDTNEKLASFSKIRSIRLQPDPFEKTPTQKIKRFLYAKGGNAGQKDKKDSG